MSQKLNTAIAIKLIYPAIQNAGQLADVGVWRWKTAVNQFAILFNGRMPSPFETRAELSSYTKYLTIPSYVQRSHAAGIGECYAHR
jgi:hypothetical protein